ncbi:hypothetical protein GPL21_33460 [Bradyrhizobium pachyrhizi]|uniref:Uncharacterized protein n=1 Tax=Bradyrhizobium pachyrhizi TaxID=280333 RepID=A0A844SSB3_9BRAD|nr:hypothetical protein [Bradyrhizobium pachyrhizi]MVT69993.1 hypothetical protein [Bradyrhizobium pachyrhizi]
MSGQREIYQSSNGDRWTLCSEDDGRVFVLHEANLPSGGVLEQIEISDFLSHGKAGPEQQALLRLIATLAHMN